MPTPATVPYNDWPLVEILPRRAFKPTLPVSVVGQHCEAPHEMAITLASLHDEPVQDLCEVVIVNDDPRSPT